MNIKQGLVAGVISVAMVFSAAQAASTSGKGMMNYEQMQSQFNTMQDMMDQAHKTRSSKERYKLMQEHMTQMLELMQNMHGMMGNGSMGMNGWGRMMGNGSMGMMGNGNMMSGAGQANTDTKKSDSKPVNQIQAMMIRRMDIMQQMMEQMMEQISMIQKYNHRK